MSVPRNAVRALLAVAGLAACGAVLADGEDGYEVAAEFENAAGLKEDFNVRVGGATVGHVEQLSVTRADRVRAVLRLDEEAGPVGPDARAVIRSANLFGEKFVDLQPGDTSRPAPSGSSIPLRRTEVPVELDEVLDVLDEDTRAQLAVLLNEAGAAMAGRSADFNAMLDALPAALDRTGRLVGEFARDNQALARLVRRSDRVLRAVVRERAELGRLVDTAQAAFTAFADRRRGLGRSVEEAAPTLVQLRQTLQQIEELALPLGPAADALRTTAPQLAATLRRLPGFAEAARPALVSARRAAPAAVELARVATPLLRDLEPAAAETGRFAASLAPVSELLEGSAPDVLGLMEGWARLTQGRDGLGHMFRNSLTLTPELIDSLIRDDAVGADQRADRKRRAEANRRPAAGGDAPQRPERTRLPAERPSPGSALEEAAPGSDTADPAPPFEGVLDFLLAP